MSLIPFSSKLIADVGISFGDEGKGRLIAEVVDELEQSAGRESPVAVVLKVNGGANSGHTAGGIKLNLLPAGVIVPSVRHLCIGSGVVADPRKFAWEALPLEKKGYVILERLRIDERTMVSELTHRLLDLAWESYRAEVLREECRGSTGRGITPAYLDEVGQWAIYYSDFLGPREAFARKLRARADRAIRTIRHVCQLSEQSWSDLFDRLTQAEQRANQESLALGTFPAEEFDFTLFRGQEPFTLEVERLIDVYWRAGTALAGNIVDVREILLQSLREERYVIGEFGQAYWLDKRHGFAPNVTASHTFTSEFFASAGIPLQPIHTMGVAKAYDTKVGTHVFLTQIPDDHPLAGILKQLEFGTSTGRQRMVGWFDAVEKGDALRYGGFQDLMINKTDALSHAGDWRGELLVCVAYEDSSGKRYHHVPRNEALRKQLKPVYRAFEGWSEDLSAVRRFTDLPIQARRYTAGCWRAVLEAAYAGEPLPAELPNLRYLGVGPSPAQIIKDIPAARDLLRMAD